MDKQAERINYLASCRKTNADCSRRLLAIQIYDTITIAMPYVKVLKHADRLSLIEELCVEELNLIDGNQFGDVKKHVSEGEVEQAFKPYFEKIQPFKTDMLKECYERIDNLYAELMKIAEIA